MYYFGELGVVDVDLGGVQSIPGKYAQFFTGQEAIDHHCIIVICTVTE